MKADKGRDTDLMRRLKSAEGHLRGIQRLLREGAPCLEMARQVLAVQRALEKVNGLVLEKHLHACIDEAVWSGCEEERRAALAELVEIFEAVGTTASSVRNGLSGWEP